MHLSFILMIQWQAHGVFAEAHQAMCEPRPAMAEKVDPSKKPSQRHEIYLLWGTFISLGIHDIYNYVYIHICIYIYIHVYIYIHL